MKIDIMTLFPETVGGVLHESILGRAEKKNIIEINCHQIRDYTENKQNQVDDYPYGGGWGCVMMAQPLKSCLDKIMSDNPGRKTRVIYMSPQGKPFTEETAKRLVGEYDHLVLVCGHYEGIDERFIEKCVDEEISIGDFVLTGGEIAAMAVADSVCRLVPGVLSDAECYEGESHWNGLLEYPQYTRPENWEGMSVPEILLNGNEKKINDWRYRQMLIRTHDKRPDMFEKLNLTEKERKAVTRRLDGEIAYRHATLGDLDAIMEIVVQAKALLKSKKVDQWQGDYPTRDSFETDINNGELYVITIGEEIGAFFMLSFRPEPTYDEITDGKWSGDEQYSVIHRAAVKDKFRGTGLSDMLFSFAECETRKSGVKFMRIDTHKKNKSMQRCIKDALFVYRGNIFITSEPGHDPLRYAFEKRLKKL